MTGNVANAPEWKTTRRFSLGSWWSRSGWFSLHWDANRCLWDADVFRPPAFPIHANKNVLSLVNVRARGENENYICMYTCVCPVYLPGFPFSSSLPCCFCDRPCKRMSVTLRLSWLNMPEPAKTRKTTNNHSS